MDRWLLITFISLLRSTFAEYVRTERRRCFLCREHIHWEREGLACSPDSLISTSFDDLSRLGSHACLSLRRIALHEDTLLNSCFYRSGQSFQPNSLLGLHTCLKLLGLVVWTSVGNTYEELLFMITIPMSLWSASSRITNLSGKARYFTKRDVCQ